MSKIDHVFICKPNAEPVFKTFGHNLNIVRYRKINSKNLKITCYCS